MNTIKELEHTVAKCYEVFAKYSAPKVLLDVCTACCMDVKLELEMRQLPLRELTAQHFYEYNCSAKSNIQPSAEIKYFLPRMLALLADEQEIHHSIELSLDRLGSTQYESFTDEERIAIEAFAKTYFEHALSFYPWENDDKQYDSIFELLLTLYIGGINIKPLLNLWQKNVTPQATCLYLHDAFWEFWGEMKVSNNFADDRSNGRVHYRKIMETWFFSHEHGRTFSYRIVGLDSTLIEKLSCRQRQAVPVPFDDQVFWILDNMRLSQ